MKFDDLLCGISSGLGIFKSFITEEKILNNFYFNSLHFTFWKSPTGLNVYAKVTSLQSSLDE